MNSESVRIGIVVSASQVAILMLYKIVPLPFP